MQWNKVYHLLLHIHNFNTTFRPNIKQNQSTCFYPTRRSVSNAEAKYIHLKMLSATGRTRLPVRSFCPPPVILEHNFCSKSQMTYFLTHWLQKLEGYRTENCQNSKSEYFFQLRDGEKSCDFSIEWKHRSIGAPFRVSPENSTNNHLKSLCQTKSVGERYLTEIQTNRRDRCYAFDRWCREEIYEMLPHYISLVFISK